MGNTRAVQSSKINSKKQYVKPSSPNTVTHKNQCIMFGLFKKDPVKQLEKEYKRLLEEAMQLQRGGDIKGYAAKTAEAEKVMDKIVELQEKGK